jgi:hypothetical protein
MTVSQLLRNVASEVDPEIGIRRVATNKDKDKLQKNWVIFKHA